MKRVLSLLFIPFTYYVCAQDLITTHKGQKIPARVLNVNRSTNTIIYEEENSIVKSAITINHVKNIKYSNGRFESFGATPFSKVAKHYPFDSTRHFISIDLSALLFRLLFSASYEYLFNGHFGLRARFTSGSGNHYGPLYRPSTKKAIGIDLNFYPFEGCFFPGRAKFFVGPSFEYGTFNYDYQYYNYLGDSLVIHGVPPDTWTTFVPIVDEYQVVQSGRQFNFIVKTGLLWRFSKHVNTSFVFGLGRVWFDSAYTSFQAGQTNATYRLGHPSGYKNRFTARFEINLGIKL